MPLSDLTGNVIEPELGQQILTELAELNADFFDLISGSKQLTRQQPDPLLPDEQLDQLRVLSKPAIRRLTSCAFTLFDLRLQDVELWRSLRARKSPEHLSTGSDGAASGRVRLFTLSAMMYLRHLADVNCFFAKLSFNASPVALEVLSSLPLNQVREIADRYPGLLRSRFGRHPDAWSELLKLAKRNDAQPMLPAKILGYQHLYRD